MLFSTNVTHVTHFEKYVSLALRHLFSFTGEQVFQWYWHMVLYTDLLHRIISKRLSEMNKNLTIARVSRIHSPLKLVSRLFKNPLMWWPRLWRINTFNLSWSSRRSRSESRRQVLIATRRGSVLSFSLIWPASTRDIGHYDPSLHLPVSGPRKSVIVASPDRLLNSPNFHCFILIPFLECRVREIK